MTSVFSLTWSASDWRRSERWAGSILNGSDTGNWYYYVPKGHIFASCEMLGAVLVFIVICFMGTNFRIIHALGWPFMVRSRAPGWPIWPACSIDAGGLLP